MSQNGKPIAFHSRKMNRAQQNYAVTEKELLLSIIATVKEFRNILLGQQITVFNDHIGTPAQACRILSRLVGLTSVVT
jgi:hypothetical protein